MEEGVKGSDLGWGCGQRSGSREILVGRGWGKGYYGGMRDLE